MKKVQSLYLMKNSLGLYKVGISHNPESRRRQLQNAGGHNVQLIRIWNVCHAYYIEQKIHREFERVRMRGEWFCFIDEANDVTDRINDLGDLIPCASQCDIQPSDEKLPASCRKVYTRTTIDAGFCKDVEILLNTKIKTHEDVYVLREAWISLITEKSARYKGLASDFCEMFDSLCVNAGSKNHQSIRYANTIVCANSIIGYGKIKPNIYTPIGKYILPSVHDDTQTLCAIEFVKRSIEQASNHLNYLNSELLREESKLCA